MLSILQKKLPFLIAVKPHRILYFKGLITLVWVDLINVILPLVVKEAVDALTQNRLLGVYSMAIAYWGLMALQSWGRYWWRIYLIGTSHRVAKELREELFAHLQKLPLRYYQRVRTGDLMSRATNDVEAVRMAIGPGILVTADALILFVFIVPVMFYFSVKLSLMAFAFYPLVPWLTKHLGNKIDTLFSIIQVKISELSGFTQEAFSAIRLIKSFVLEGETSRRFQILSKDLSLEGVNLAKYEALFSPILSLLTQMGTLLILLIGARDTITGAISLGTFIAFQRFVVQLAWPMEAIGWAVTLNREGGAAFRRLEEILKTETNRDSYPRVMKPASYEGILNIPRLDFSFSERDEGFNLHLKQLSLHKGEKIGIVGPVGAGKTTLLNLVLRLYEPGPGSIYFQGEDILEIPLPVLRTEIGNVEQQVFLFSETIRANAVLGIEETAIAEEEIRALSKVAGIDTEIAELERDYDTVLGERGVNLSGGQKQRIAFLRALARKPKLLLLDDCFSAVDVEVESRIIDRFFAEYSHLSVLLATHRLSAMPRMNTIWVIDQGRCVATGSHKQLLRTNRLYATLWNESERRTIEEKGKEALPTKDENLV